MNVTLPWGLIAIFISLSMFYYFNQKAKIKRDDRRLRSKEKQQEYLDSLLKSLNKEDPKGDEDINN